MKTWRDKYQDLINRYSKRIKWVSVYKNKKFIPDIDLHPFFDRVHYAISGRYATLKQFKKAVKQIEYNLKKQARLK